MAKLSTQKVLNYRVLSELEVGFMVPIPLPKRCTVGVKLPTSRPSWKWVPKGKNTPKNADHI